MKDLRQRTPARVANEDALFVFAGRPAILFDLFKETNGFEIDGCFLKQAAYAQTVFGGNAKIAFETGR
jgi:hypothetical protein